MTQRYAMNGFQLAHLVHRLAPLPRWRRAAISAALIVISLFVIGLAWHGRSAGRRNAVQATLADAPSWDLPRPQWPRYMPEVPPSGETAPQPPVAASITPTVIHGAPQADAPLPWVTAGPELFAPAVEPTLPAKAESQPAAQESPPELPVSRPAAPAPVPVPVAPPGPVRLSVPPATEPVRSAGMEKIATQSDQQIRHGFELANRGAYFVARAEFTVALRLIAQGLDNERNTTVHSQALIAALTAIKEAQDFIPAAGKLEGELDLPRVVAGHRTPILKNVPAEQLQAMRALKEYFTFAQEQFALAAGKEVSGSVALEALGKLHAALSDQQSGEMALPVAKAITFFHAAILVCPRNYMAANDLGVLLAHNGDFAEARRMLEHSVLVCRCSENLNNLSFVYRHLGQQHLAELASAKAQAAKAVEVARQKSANLSAGGSVEWVDPAALAAAPDQWSDPSAKPAVPAGQQDPAAASPASSRPVVGMSPAPFGPATAR